jgi:hypothetical protein
LPELGATEPEEGEKEQLHVAEQVKEGSGRIRLFRPNARLSCRGRLQAR